MAIRLGLFFLLMTLALAIVANASPTFDTRLGVATRLLRENTGLPGTCNGEIGECIDPEEEGMMDSESNRRTLAGQGGYISYEAMRRNSIPCNQRGASYYACTGNQQANPYARGCNNISQCPRNGR